MYLYFAVFVLCLLNTPPRSYITFRNFRIRKKKLYSYIQWHTDKKKQGGIKNILQTERTTVMSEAAVCAGIQAKNLLHNPAPLI